ncbi:hypothetical protein V5O48_018406 [Marasmius crinis-equi]|uniref:Uncharacterized protein n=1 Tax=Marasmius crinis-equi TaxID=585013 RepID=A0ABR3ELG2_9AGAR
MTFTSNTYKLIGDVEIIFTDSGAPPQSSDYTILIVFHGGSFNGQLEDLAEGRKVFLDRLEQQIADSGEVLQGSRYLRTPPPPVVCYGYEVPSNIQVYEALTDPDSETPEESSFFDHKNPHSGNLADMDMRKRSDEPTITD